MNVVYNLSKYLITGEVVDGELKWNFLDISEPHHPQFVDFTDIGFEALLEISNQALSQMDNILEQLVTMIQAELEQRMKRAQNTELPNIDNIHAALVPSVDVVCAGVEDKSKKPRVAVFLGGHIEITEEKLTTWMVKWEDGVTNDLNHLSGLGLLRLADMLLANGPDFTPEEKRLYKSIQDAMATKTTVSEAISENPCIFFGDERIIHVNNEWRIWYSYGTQIPLNALPKSKIQEISDYLSNKKATLSKDEVAVLQYTKEALMFSQAVKGDSTEADRSELRKLFIENIKVKDGITTVKLGDTTIENTTGNNMWSVYVLGDHEMTCNDLAMVIEFVLKKCPWPKAL